MTSLVRSDYFYETRRWVLPDKIVASRTTMGSGLDPDHHLDGFKPYVYRGTGEDTLTEGLELTEWGDVIPAVPPKPTRKELNARNKARAGAWLRVYRTEMEKQRRVQMREANRLRRIEAQRKSDALWVAERAARKRQRTYPQGYTKPAPAVTPIRRSKYGRGWTPSMDLDVDALMAELDED